MSLNHEHGATLAPEAYDVDSPEHPALKKFSRPLETVKHVLGTTLMTGMKGALIGGLALAAGGAVLGLPFFGIAAATNGGLAAGIGGGMVANGLVTGALAGLGIGSAVGFVQSASNAEDAVEEKAQELISKDMRRRQLAANQEMMAMNMQRLRSSQVAMGGGMPSHGLSAMQGKSEGYGVTV